MYVCRVLTRLCQDHRSSSRTYVKLDSAPPVRTRRGANESHRGMGLVSLASHKSHSPTT